jgi:hypothetical protein
MDKGAEVAQTRVGPHRRRGRPALNPAQRAVGVHVTLTAQVYDALWKRATTARRSVPAQIRHELTVRLNAAEK